VDLLIFTINTNIVSQLQDPVYVQSKIDDFFGRFKIATMMHRCGMRKHHGHSIRSLTQAIFTLPFVGKNFFRDAVIVSALQCVGLSKNKLVNV
jgi:hypothetical protein